MSEPTANPKTAGRTISPTIKSRSAWTWLVLSIVLGLVTDLWSKAAAFERIAGYPVVVERSRVLESGDPSMIIPPHDAVTVIPSVLEFTLVLNPGAVFGIGAGQRWFFVIFTVVAVAVSIMLFARWTRPRDHSAHIGFGLIISGGIGNLYDRLTFACVRDFIHPLPGVQLPFGLSWPGGGSTDVWPYVSNLADLYLLVGIGLLLVYTWRLPEHPHTDIKPEQPDPGETP